MPTLHLYRFRCFDPLHNRWLVARYATQHHDVEQRYAQYELIEPPEVRHVAEDWRFADASQLARRVDR